MEENKRHGCVTVWLVFFVTANLVAAFLYFFASKIFGFDLVQHYYGHFTLLIILGALNVVFAFALLRRKLWGFYGFIFSGLFAFAINLDAGIPLQFCFAGIVGLVILFAVLQIRKNDKSEWDSMEKRKVESENKEEW